MKSLVERPEQVIKRQVGALQFALRRTQVEMPAADAFFFRHVLEYVLGGRQLVVDLVKIRNQHPAPFPKAVERSGFGVLFGAGFGIGNIQQGQQLHGFGLSQARKGGDEPVYGDESGQPAGKPVFFFGQGGEPAAQHTPQSHGGQHHLQVGLPQVKTVDVAAYVIDERALSCHESRF